MKTKRSYKPGMGTAYQDAHYMLEHFPRINKIPGREYHNGRLFIDIDPTMDTEWGYCMPAAEAACIFKAARWEIGLAGNFPTRRKYLATLMHELLHLYQMAVQGFRIPNHGKTFKGYINTTGKRQLDKMLRRELSAFKKHYAIVSEDYQ